MVALAILGTAFTVLLSAHTSASRLSGYARRQFEATALAREVLARTEVEGLPTFGKDSGDFGPEFASYRWERAVSDGPIPALKDVKEVIVRVLWLEGQQTRSTQVVFYYLKKDT